VATHDYVIANGTGAAVRSDLNNALAAIVSQNSSASAPATTYAYMLWADITAGIMKMRNGANSAWISLWELDGTFIASDISLAAGSAAAPSLFFTGDTNTGLFSPGADQVAISTNGTGRLYIAADGTVGIGQASDNSSYRLNVYNSSSDASFVSIGNNVSGSGSLNGLVIGMNNSEAVFLNRENGPCIFWTNNSEKARLTSDGKFLVGTSSARSNFYNTSTIAPSLQVEGTTYGSSSLSLIANGNAAAGNPVPVVLLGRTRGTSVGSTTVVSAGDSLGSVSYQGSDGTEFVEAASIAAEVDGTPGANDMPGRLVFSTTADGAASPTERMRITSDGGICLGKTVTTYNQQGAAWSGSEFNISSTSTATLLINRATDDGSLIRFFQDSSEEGSISVSGTTVSYNGAHLSRWSQLPSGAERTEILRGSVLSNIDEMCEWDEEDNEQLNRMKVSDVESDKNVSGVFQAWDDDDDTYTNDFYCAMTGDFIIRIAEGVTVERGDLLMSAGDGTAKPQDDDIIRSKTVAKVTSTNVSCTYDDGSYCVPCVLMAC
jgi:hypothetical protein